MNDIIEDINSRIKEMTHYKFLKCQVIGSQVSSEYLYPLGFAILSIIGQFRKDYEYHPKVEEYYQILSTKINESVSEILGGLEYEAIE